MVKRELMIDRINIKEGTSLTDKRYLPMNATQEIVNDEVNQIIVEKYGGNRSLGNRILAQSI